MAFPWRSPRRAASRWWAGCSRGRRGRSSPWSSRRTPLCSTRRPPWTENYKIRSQNCRPHLNHNGRGSVLLTIKKIMKSKSFSSLTGNWTPISRVTGGDTDHYTIKRIACHKPIFWTNNSLSIYNVAVPGIFGQVIHHLKTVKNQLNGLCMMLQSWSNPKVQSPSCSTQNISNPPRPSQMLCWFRHWRNV